MNNLKEIKSTVVGIILFIVGLVLASKAYLSDTTAVWNDYIMPSVLMVFGIGMLFAPDKTINWIFKKANKNVGK